jgi:hypothetical protein
MEAEYAATSDKDKRRTALEDHRQRMRDLKIDVDKRNKERVRVGAADAVGLDYYLAEAELWLLEGEVTGSGVEKDK